MLWLCRWNDRNAVALPMERWLDMWLALSCWFSWTAKPSNVALAIAMILVEAFDLKRMRLINLAL